MDTATYQKLKRKYTEKMLEIMNALDKYKGSSTNFFDFISCTVNLTSQLATEWASSDIHGKEHLQKLIFPEGVYYNLENEAFRTLKLNRAFQLIKDLKRVSGENKNGEGCILTTFPSQVGAARFELATFPILIGTQ